MWPLIFAVIFYYVLAKRYAKRGHHIGREKLDRYYKTGDFKNLL